MLVDKDAVLWYTILCEVLGSPCLSRPTTISNVWAAIPGLEEPGLGAGCPRALPLAPTIRSTEMPLAS